MSRSARTIIALIVVVLVVVVVVLGYIWISGGSATPSATLFAPTLDLSNRLPTTAPTLASTAAVTQAVTAETAATEALATSEATQATSASATTAASAATAAVSAAQLTVMNIVPDQSEVHFITHEVLRGSPNTVDGCTRDIAGQLGVDFSTPQNSQVGVIKVDARTFATDNELRNRAIRGQILQSSEDQFEFISFKPTSISGLPDAVTINQQFEFQITGDLTIRDITKPVTFDVTVTPDAQTEIKGTATATVQRSDYNLTIPNVPGVADVDQAVDIKISFLANTESAQQPSSSTCGS